MSTIELPTTTPSAILATSLAFSLVLIPKPTAIGSLLFDFKVSIGFTSFEKSGVLVPVIPVIET